MKIELTEHCKLRLEMRNISDEYPHSIITQPDFKLVNSATNHEIAIKKLFYKEMDRFLMVAYDLIDDIARVVTIHPITESQMNNRLKTGRWRLEE